MRVELIELQVLESFQDTDAAQRNGSYDSAFTPTDGAVAAAWIDDAVREVQL